MLLAEFKTPWNFLAEMPAHARARGAGVVNSDANQFWWGYFSICANLFRAELLTAPRLFFLGAWWRGAECGLARAEEGFGEESARASAFFFEKIGGYYINSTSDFIRLKILT